jgi:hypothetical protein
MNGESSIIGKLDRFLKFSFKSVFDLDNNCIWFIIKVR